MSTLTQAAGRPPLSYSLPGFHPAAYAHARVWLDNLRALGFRWVTFHPTFSVDPEWLTIGPGPDIEQAFSHARELGFSIRMEPHLDYTSTLTGGTYRWRRDMEIRPSGHYFTDVLLPLAALLPDEFTLGSELDLSADLFAPEWAGAADALRSSGFALGHKLNHDWTGGRALHRYLSGLDYVAISFYPAASWELDAAFTVGEFGLGSTDVSRPWHFDAATFRTADDFALRRAFYLQTLAWLSTRTGRAASFWTAGHFDVLGIMHPEWRDDAVVEAVCRYNQAR